MSQVPYYLLKLSPSELLTLVNALRLASTTNREFREMMIKLGDIYRNEFILTSEVPNETED